MKKRDWLIERGLASPGRGRFSYEAQEAIEAAERDGVVFDDRPTVHNWTVKKAPVKTKYRSVGILIGYTEKGWRVEFTNCSKCGEHADFCGCDQLGLPYIVKTLDESSRRLIGWKHDN